jgi:hypothetical protein
MLSSDQFSEQFWNSIQNQFSSDPQLIVFLMIENVMASSHGAAGAPPEKTKATLPDHGA